MKKRRTFVTVIKNKHTEREKERNKYNYKITKQ